MRTELTEKRRIVENIVNNNRAKMNNLTILETFTNANHEQPLTKHANYMTKTKGEAMGQQTRSSIDQTAGNGSPFDSLRIY